MPLYNEGIEDDTPAKEVAAMTQPPGPIGPFCQSCGMPLAKPEDFGRTAEGFRQNDYCCYCYDDGAFTQPGITMEGMIAFSASMVAEQMGEAEARALHEAVIPMLKRWRAA